MEETEKMMALKKVYAEIILNTAKEAAAKIMVSERKAQEYCYDIKTTKDEALRLLLRLKQSMDVKINEVEMKSEDQQRKIEVLEAQLQEAEDIVTNLRAELDVAHTKLDKLEKNQMSSVSRLMYKAENVIGSAEPELPSIISRRKEPELYLNGCTQRLQTRNGNLLKDHLNNLKGLKEDEEVEKMCVKPTVIADRVCVEEGSVIVKEAEDEEPINIMQLFKSLRKWKPNGSRCNRHNASSLKHVSHMAKEVCPDPSTSYVHLSGVQDMHESDNRYGGTQTFEVSEMGTLPEHVSIFRSDEKLTKFVNEDGKATRSLALTINQYASEGSLDALAPLGSNTEVEGKKSSSSDLDVKLVETSDGLSSPPSKDKVLKYTFQRKRKKDSVASEDECLSNEENLPREKMAKKHNGNPKHVKSSDVNGSLQMQNLRRMAQVERQRVTMSEKKWIK